MPRSKKQVRIWTYTEAAQAVPYVRRLLVALRERFVSVWHFYRLNRLGPDSMEYHPEMLLHRQEGVAALEELQRLGVLAYDSPRRGIALFPIFIHCGQGGTQREAYFVFKDSRDSVETFIFNDELSTTSFAPTTTCSGTKSRCPKHGGGREPPRCWTRGPGHEEEAAGRAAFHPV